MNSHATDLVVYAKSSSGVTKLANLRVIASFDVVLARWKSPTKAKYGKFYTQKSSLCMRSFRRDNIALELIH